MQLIESIRCLNGQLENLALHQARLDRARSEVLGLPPAWQLGKLISIPTEARSGLWKCRVLYAEEIVSIQFEPYQMKAIRELVLVEDNDIDYSHKYADRSGLQRHLDSFAGHPEIDILIVKNGLITDSSYANVLFYDGCHWVTPEIPLLAGVMRAYYLTKRWIIAKSIGPEDLRKYKKVALINALRKLDSQFLLDIRQVSGR
jgi:4-amino-4-deoxychorismate lyase